MTFLRSFCLLGFCLVFSNSCGIVPWPVSTAQSVSDVVIWNNVGKTTSEFVASELIKKDCLWARAFDRVPVCMTKSEERDYVLSKNCEVYTWNSFGLPRCKKDKKE